MTASSQAPFFDGTFPHTWQAEILPARPLILPARHFIYPREAEEVERGALEVLIRPAPIHLNEKAAEKLIRVVGRGFIPGKTPIESARALAPEGSSAEIAPAAPGPGSPRTGLRPGGGDPSRLGTGEINSTIPSISQPQEFLATCALGFRDPAVPTGLWSTPNPDEICAVSGGYAYIINTAAPERFTMIAYRPVLQLIPVAAENLLLFVGHHAVLAWGANGQAWQSEKLSDEGLTLEEINGPILRGLGWTLMTDKETPFALDLKTGLRSI